MSQKPLTKKQLVSALEMVQACDGNVAKAARENQVPVTTLKRHYMAALVSKVVAVSVGVDEAEDDDGSLEHKIKVLEAQLKAFKNNEISHKLIRSKVMKLSDVSATAPKWLLLSENRQSHHESVPTIMASDWHYGEVIDPTQIGGVNEYNLDIAKQRARTLIEGATDLLKNHLSNADYPGIIFALGGDMVSGDIHDELAATNEIPLIPAMLELLDLLVWCIGTLADNFGAVFVPCVTGNHGRNTNKIRCKDRHYTSFDWLLYVLLEKHFKSDERVTFMVSDGPDAYYKVYNHRYLLSHGDQFRGGDSMIGCLGPIIRGDHKKRSRNMQVGAEYDTMILGHWHQLIQTQRLIVNGSLCGYNEYAYANNFGFEVPKQALWLTHATRGITFSCPVHADPSASFVKQKAEWLSVPAKK